MDPTHSDAPPSIGSDDAHEITDLRERLAYLEFDEQDRAQLQELNDRLRDRRDDFVDEFYQHLFKFETTARFLRDPQLVERLKVSQMEHLQHMLAAEWSDAYMDRCFRVGDVHARVGISPQMFLGAYNKYLQFCVECLGQDFGESSQHFARMVRSVQKAVFFDIGLTLEAYFSRMTANLRRALDLLYQANAELRQFAQLTSHDLKTPLATMVNLCDEALDEFGRQIPSEAGKLIQAARNRALRMSATIDDLLQSAISMHEEPAQQALSPEPVLLETVELLRPAMEQKHIAITLPEHMPAVRADRVRLREVFFNLLSNAVKYHDKSAGKIIVRAAADERHCTISIIDDGPGIPPHELTRIFVPFRRLDAHRDTPGSGLGLYFAKTLVEQQGGAIWAESKPGQGSSFHIRLSLAELPEE